MATRKKEEKTERLQLIVDVVVRFDTRAARMDVLNDLKRELGVEFSSIGEKGWASATTGKVREVRHDSAELVLKADALAKELREVLEWVRVENAPLRDQEIASIKQVIFEYEAAGPRKLPKGKA